MRYLAAYLLAQLAGKTDPSAADIEKILSSVGVDADRKRIEVVLTKLKGKDVEAVIAEGSKKLASLPAAGAAAPAAAPAAGGKADEKSKPAAEEKPKKEEKKEEEEGDDDMGFGLFD